MLCKICNKNGGAVPVAVTIIITLAIVLCTLAVFGVSKAAADSDEYDELLTVSVTADGKTISVHTVEMTVSKLLALTDIVLGENDEINVPADSIITDGMNVSVDRVEYRTHERSTFIPYETEYTETPLLKIGDEEIAQTGVNGIAAVFIRDKYINGQLVSSEVVSEIKTEPRNEIIAQGTALQTPYSKREGNYRLENGIPTEYAYKLSGKVTSYTAPEGSGTYSGRPLVIGSVGVDPDVIPFGSEVYIVSQDGSKVYGYAIASDTGDITDIIADAYMGVTSEHWDDAMAWCAQFCDVYVLTVGDNSVSWR